MNVTYLEVNQEASGTPILVSALEAYLWTMSSAKVQKPRWRIVTSLDMALWTVITQRTSVSSVMQVIK